MVDLGQLHDLLEKERRMDELTQLDDDFYVKTARYIRDLEKEIEKKSDENKINMLKDEKKSATVFIKKIFDRRTGKLLRLASLNVKGLDVEEDNMTSEEKDIFNNLTTELKKGRKEVENEIFSRKNEKKQDKKKEKEKFNNSEKSLTVVRVLDNFPKFIGSDERSHHLTKEDIVSLPKEDAQILIKRGIAENIEGD